MQLYLTIPWAYGPKQKNVLEAQGLPVTQFHTDVFDREPLWCRLTSTLQR